ncbi:hypothetical protein HY623_02125 [Candidatus Uhrbacteria bacterium]|nr:hypothetical protein [Candidatus Uhrbacteria bacterium]
MSISFKRIKSKWTSTEAIRSQKIALSCHKLSRAHIGVLLTIAVFSLVYLVQVNTLATKGYAIRELERDIAIQKKEYERLQLDIIERQSMGALQERIAQLGFVPADRIDYLSPTAAVATAVAKPSR